MVGHHATELLVGAQSKTKRTVWDPEMHGHATTRWDAVSELPAGAGCQEKGNLPAEGEVFLS